MTLFDRIRLVVSAVIRQAAHDLLAEDEAAPAPGSRPTPGEMAAGAERLAGVLDEVQARLNGLQVELAQAALRRQQLETEWQAARSRAAALEAEADAALQVGQEDAARRQLQAARLAHQQAGELEQRCTESAAFVAETEAQMAALQTGLDTAQRKAAALAEREHSAQVLEELHELARLLRRGLTSIDTGLEAREEAVARREDRLAARKELDQDPWR